MDMGCTGKALAPAQGADAALPDSSCIRLMSATELPLVPAGHQGVMQATGETKKSRGFLLPAQGQDGKEHLLPQSSRLMHRHRHHQKEKYWTFMLPTKAGWSIVRAANRAAGPDAQAS